MPSSQLAHMAITKWTIPYPLVTSSEDKIWLDVNVKSFAWEKSTIGIAARADDGHPTVLRLYPLRLDPKGRGSNEPVPWVNLYFLVCPHLINTVGRLEHDGLIEKFDDILEHDSVMASLYTRDHDSYATERWELLTPEDKEYCVQKHYDTVLKESGICGMQYKRRIKCLHAHYAHYLATGGQTLVGSWIADALGTL